MKVLSEDEFTSRLEYLRPLHPSKEVESNATTAWPIPFEYGANEKGTRISVPKALQIIAELRAAVAEENARQMRRYFDEEKARGDRLVSEISKSNEELLDARTEISTLKRKINARRRATRKR